MQSFRQVQLRWQHIQRCVRIRNGVPQTSLPVQQQRHVHDTSSRRRRVKSGVRVGNPERGILGCRVLRYNAHSTRGSDEPTEPALVRRCYVLHGLLGSSSNWVNYVRQHLGQAVPLDESWEFCLLDLPNHGLSAGFSPPHTIHNAVCDVIDTIAAFGPADVLLGHSLGGKIALEVARRIPRSNDASVGGSGDSGGRPLHVCALDSVPGVWNAFGDDVDRNSVGKLLELINSIDPPIPSRTWVVEMAKEAGFSANVAQWLGTSVRRMHAGQHGQRATAISKHVSDQDNGMVWAFDAGAAEELLRSYAGMNSWDVLEAPWKVCVAGEHVTTQLVVASRSPRWKVPQIAERLKLLVDAGVADGSGAVARVDWLENSGHWVHVDNPTGLLELLRPVFSATEPTQE